MEISNFTFLTSSTTENMGKFISVVCHGNQHFTFWQIKLQYEIFRSLTTEMFVTDIMEGCIFHPGLSFLDMDSISRRKAKKREKRKPKEIENVLISINTWKLYKKNIL